MAHPRGTTFALLAAVAASLAFAAGPADAASRPVRKAIWGPATYKGISQFPIYRDLGVKIYEFPVLWNQIAVRPPAAPRNPSDPAYVWPAELDQAVSEAHHAGIRMLIRVSQAPAWSNGGKASKTPAADPRDYADFLVAISKRYPSVHLWMVWEEPMRSVVYDIDPQTPLQRANGAPLNKAQQRQVRVYADMLDASYGALKARSSRNLIIGGNTYTTGDVNPESFIKNMRMRDGRPPRMDMYGHNPFGVRMPDLRADPLARGTADFSDLDTLASWIDRWLRRSGRNHKLPLFLSEYTVPTDVPSAQWTYHVTRAVQAQWLEAALRIARSWSRIYAVGWYTLRDPDPTVDPISGRDGLIDLSGKHKPAYGVFKRG